MISIIMPIFNREDLIEETLTSIINQTYNDWECIIIDDGSTDNTVAILKEWSLKDKRFVVDSRPQSVKKGPSGCRNFAILKSKGSYIQFFDSDDIMHPEHLEKKIKAIGNNDFSICKILDFTEEFLPENMGERDIAELKRPDNLFVEFVKGDFPVFMVAPLWKKSSLLPYLPIREDLHILEDHELYARVFFDKKEYSIIDEYLIFYRMGHNSSSGTFYSNVESGLASFLKAKESVLNLTQDDGVKLAVLKMVLGFFRQALSERNFQAARECLNFTINNNLWTSHRLALIRITLAYNVFKVVKRGDTKFKQFFKM